MHVEFWHWGVLGFLLLAAEMLLPTGFFLIWIGGAALLVGGIAWLAPAVGWQAQLLLFGVLSVLSFVLWKRIHPANLPSDQPNLNRRGQSYVGRDFTLGEPIVNGVGRLRVDDSQWRITGPDAAAGARVRVVGADGAILRVELTD